MYRKFLFCFLFAIAVCISSSEALAAQQLGTDPSGSGAPTPLQQGTSYSTVPSTTPIPSRMPSGQGSGGAIGYQPQNGIYQPGFNPSPEPLYAPGQRFNHARSFTGMPAWAQKGQADVLGVYPPFGANLFQGHFAGTYYEGLNDNYIIMPGDRIQENIWGAHAYNDTLMVHQQGN